MAGSGQSNPILQIVEKVAEESLSKRRILAVIDSRLFLRFSVFLMKYLTLKHRVKVMYATVNLPSTAIIKLMKKTKVNENQIYLIDSSESESRETKEIHEFSNLRCVPGLFAPAILARMVEELGREIEKDVMMVFIVGNASSMSFYASNDRIREFAHEMKKLTERDERLKSVVVIDNANSYVRKIFEDVCNDVIECVRE